MKKLLPLLLTLAASLWGGEICLAQSAPIKGIVRDASTKAPISFASVAIKGTSQGCVTAADGSYAFSSVPAGATLVFSCVGYTTQEVKPTPSQTTLNVDLSADAIALDAVVAVGYGTMKRSDITGAVSSVSAEDLKIAPVATVDQAMQGRIAGVTVNANSGQPGQAAEVRIRGIGTVNNSAPIYVVDGIITEDIGFLNAGDIESMEVLKDASSTAIYGSRGANGVIIITTKSGGDGRVNVTFDGYVGIQNMWRTLDLMGRDEQAAAIVRIGNDASERKAFKRGFNYWLKNYRLGSTAYFPTQESFDFSAQETDWQREVQQRNALIQNYYISADGGTDKVKYSLSAGYFSQDGTIKESYYNRLTLRSNVSYQIAKWLRVGTSVSYVTSRARSLSNNAEFNGILFKAISMAPWDPTHYPAGTMSYAGEDIGGKIAASTNYKNVYNPFTELEMSHPKNTDERLLGNIHLEIKPLEWLTLKSSVSMNRYFAQSRSFTDSYYFSEYDSRLKNGVGASMARSTEMFYENTITLAKKLGKHDLSLMIGQTTEEYNYYSISGGGASITNTDPSKWYISQTTEEQSVGDGVSRSRRLSFLGRLFYSYDNRYLLTVNFRADGSSKFPENTWGYFPSFAGAWRISEEGFLKDSETVDNLKLRLSWGQIGNDKIGENDFAQSISTPGPIFVSYPFGVTNSTTTAWGPGEFPAGAAVLTYVNTGGRWEYTEQWDLGLDFGFWNNRLYGTVDAYIRDTHDMLLNVTAPAIVGNRFASKANVATVRNKGIEVMVGHSHSVRGFTYDINANVAFVNNRLTRLNGGERLDWGLRMSDEGIPLFSLWGWEYDGIYQSDEEVARHQWGVSADELLEHAGDARYRDLNGDGIINDSDRTNIGNPFPWLTYGANIALSWKGIDLSMFFQGVYGNKIYNAMRTRTEGDGRTATLSTTMRNVWTPETHDGTIPNPSASGSSRNREQSSRLVEDGSYLRLKNLQLGYTLPTRITRKFYVSRWRFYVSCSNLFTVTDYTGYDPEVGGGIDWGNYPQSRTVLFGTTINF